MTSACRGEARNMMPRRSWSYRGIETCIISILQQASPKLSGHSEDCRAQFTMVSMDALRIIHRSQLDRVLWIVRLPYNAYSTTPVGLCSLARAVLVALCVELYRDCTIDLAGRSDIERDANILQNILVSSLCRAHCGCIQAAIRC